MQRNSSIKQYGPVAFHVLLGMISPFFAAIATLYGAGITLYFFFILLQRRNQDGMAHKAALYIAGMEVWLHMNKAALPWEFGKIAGIGFLLIGMLLEKKKNYNWSYSILIVLLLPSLILSAPESLRDFREFLTFQLGGDILLVFGLIYFSKRSISLTAFIDMLRFALFPIITMLVHIILRSPSIANIRFELGANFAASGGYGPNQVSTILGLGVLITGFVYLWKLPPLVTRRIDLILLILLAVRALLTFSRGGLAVAVIILGLAYLLMLVAQGKLSGGKVFSLAFFGVLIAGMIFFVNGLTGGALFQRLRGDTYTTATQLEEKTIDKVTSGRSEIIITDVEMFLDYPIFGVGLGASNQLRPQYGYNNISHIEQSRLLSEHGFFGLLFLLSLIFIPLSAYFARRGLNQSILLIFTMLSFLTMAHSATRLAMVGLYFGVGLLKIYFEKPPLHRQPALEARADTHHD